ncbi:MAG: hypothetical protein M3Z04_06365, partial [Chloroflexota bacterium]|nr:hypothetical protein [Chloroflexota bacterium]
TAAAGAGLPGNPTFGFAAATSVPASPEVPAADAQSNAPLTGSRATQRSALATAPAAAAPIAKVPAPSYAYSNTTGSGAVTTPATGAATTQQLTPPPPTAAPLSLLPWEIGLVLAALAFALASIPVARRARSS